MLTKLKEIEGMKKAQGTTMAISNAGESGKMKLMNKNIQHNGLKMSSVKTRTAHSRDRCGQC
jgi:hypothetical protein